MMATATRMYQRRERIVWFYQGQSQILIVAAVLSGFLTAGYLVLRVKTG